MTDHPVSNARMIAELQMAALRFRIGGPDSAWTTPACPPAPVHGDDPGRIQLAAPHHQRHVKGRA